VGSEMCIRDRMNEEREDKVRRTDQIVSKMIELWPIWALLASGVVGGLKLKWMADDLRNDVDSIIAKDVPEEHRMTAMEKDIEWLKHGGQK